MADDLQILEDWVAPLLAKMTPAESRRLALTMAREMQAAQRRTMAAQTAPDGSAWTPRKPPARDARGQIRRAAQRGKVRAAMFRGLRSPKWMKSAATPGEASVGFVGRAARIAALHHWGGPDRVTPRGPVYDSPARPLIGIPDALAERLRDMLAQHLAG